MSANFRLEHRERQDARKLLDRMTADPSRGGVPGLGKALAKLGRCTTEDEARQVMMDFLQGEE